MRKSIIISGIAAGIAGAAAFYFATRNRDAIRAQVQQRTRESSLWLHEQQRELADGLHRIEGEIARLGDDVRHRLDALAQQAAGAVQPRVGEWHLERGDLQDDLRGLPGRR